MYVENARETVPATFLRARTYGARGALPASEGAPKKGCMPYIETLLCRGGILQTKTYVGHWYLESGCARYDATGAHRKYFYLRCAVRLRQPCLTRLPQQNSSSLILVFERPPFAAARPLQVAAHESGKRRAMHQLHLGMRDNNGHYKETLLSFKTN